ncbi:pyridoxal 5'-phosphate synthase [Actinotalea sp. K2]|uniref:pyridoxine/pyridoxamine 5'-phosphate oxidase n=1 Tax=Actinotalea sp. K2 TaxID=2939438 RepID=UPI00201793D0|nr:pyridoxal 5'-phosphate synthase [Actinotalea sp. K2]MCL3860516.1 pyridoxal 5'-phosphate synthase [Actinotalea sp. K2]
MDQDEETTMGDRLTMRTRLRRMPALAGDLPSFVPEALPPDPVDLFLSWFEQAVDAGVPEPHAVTLATAGADGAPSSRVVVLKDVREGAFEFATDRRSRKARDLDVNPRGALSFYWQPQGRQVRVAGPVRALDAVLSAQDYLARSPASRAAALATCPGERLGSATELAEAIERARERVDAEPGLVLPEWVVYSLVPDEVELWQGSPTRAHVRVLYRRDGQGWTHRLEWP